MDVVFFELRWWVSEWVSECVCMWVYVGVFRLDLFEGESVRYFIISMLLVLGV